MAGEVVEVVERVLREAQQVVRFGLLEGRGLDGYTEGEDRTASLEIQKSKDRS